MDFANFFFCRIVTLLHSNGRTDDSGDLRVLRKHMGDGGNANSENLLHTTLLKLPFSWENSATPPICSLSQSSRCCFLQKSTCRQADRQDIHGYHWSSCLDGEPHKALVSHDNPVAVRNCQQRLVRPSWHHKGRTAVSNNVSDRRCTAVGSTECQTKVTIEGNHIAATYGHTSKGNTGE